MAGIRSEIACKSLSKRKEVSVRYPEHKKRNEPPTA